MSQRTFNVKLTIREPGNQPEETTKDCRILADDWVSAMVLVLNTHQQNSSARLYKSSVTATVTEVE